MTGESIRSVSVTNLGSYAEGSIGPEDRMSRGKISAAEIDKFVDDLVSDKYYVPVGELGPNAAGGTFSLVVADALTTRRFLRSGQKAAEHAETVYDWLMQYADTDENHCCIPRQCIDGRPVASGSAPSQVLIGDHDSTHGHDDCGAMKRLPDILAFTSANGDILREIAEREGVQVAPETHAKIVSSAQLLLEQDYCSDAMSLRTAFTNVAGEACMTQLFGDHKEVAARKNRNPAITLDRAVLQSQYSALQAFNIDAGAFPAAAAVISITPDEAAQKTVAMEYFNTAAALVLAHPSLRYIAETR